ETIITEFKRYRVTPELLFAQMEAMNKYIHKESDEQSLLKKLDDLHYIYQKLMAKLQGTYIDAEDSLNLLAEKVPLSERLVNAEIYIDGFHRFTPQELQVVEALMNKCKTVNVSLVLERPNEI